MYAAKYAADHPDKPAVIMATTGETITFADFEARSNRFAHLLRDLGLKRLDHIAIFMENNPRIFECEGAAERTGLYYTTINSYLSPEEAAYIINDSEAQVVITSAAKRDVAALLPPLCPNVRRFLMVDGTVDGWESYEDAVAGYPTTPLDDEQRYSFYHDDHFQSVKRHTLTWAEGTRDDYDIVLWWLCSLLFQDRSA